MRALLAAMLLAVAAPVLAEGIEVKGWAPVLVDFPAVLDGQDVLLCWLEGEPALEWYHRVDLGFAGRRRLPGARSARPCTRCLPIPGWA